LHVLREILFIEVLFSYVYLRYGLKKKSLPLCDDRASRQIPEASFTSWTIFLNLLFYCIKKIPLPLCGFKQWW
jgi:hypothetical protein